MFFDARSAKTLKQGEHIVVQGCPALRLEATASTKSWTYRYRSLADSAKLKQVKLGQWPAMSPAQSAAEWQAARDLLEQRRDPADERKLARKALAQPVAQVYTLARLVDDYAARYLKVNREAKAPATSSSVCAMRSRDGSRHPWPRWGALLSTTSLKVSPTAPSWPSP
ncbi:Arm DNA-binding domain-containing protein [Delftia acidovorans]|uniref:Arm DNA-binding domain-containing protein n=1 Tax=Delftia acidovorans TaxID=80866 RepID=UPI001A972698